MIPRSKGWSIDVVLGGKKTTFMLLNFSDKFSGWQPALSIKRRMEQPLLDSWQFSLVSTASIISPVIQALFWLK